jgi:hypothetical protein
LRRPPLPSALLAAGLVGLVLGPALPRLHSHFLGVAEVDHFGTQWFYWFTQRGLLEGGSLLHTELFFHPWGKDVLLHTGANVLDALLALPLRLLLGPVLGYNLFLILCMAASGWAFSRLARHFVDCRLTVSATSVLFALSPFVLYEAAEGRPTQAILALIPLFLLQAWRAGEQRGWRAPLLGGLLLAVLGYQYWYYAIFGGFVAAALCGWRIAVPPEGAGGRARIAGRYLLTGAVALALAAPVVAPMLLHTELAGAEVPGLLDVAAWGWGSGVAPVTQEGHRIALLGWQPLLGQMAYFMQDEAGAQRLVGHQQAPGIVLLLVLVAWLRAPGRLDRGGFGVAVLTATILAVGPMVLVAGFVVPNPAYLALAKAFGFMQRLWWPARAFAFVNVLGFLAATVVLSRAARLGPRGHGAVLLGVGLVFGLGLGRAGLAPFPTWDATIPAGYRCLAHGEPGAIIELPYGWTQAHLYHQSAHGRPIMGGMLERNPVFIPAEARSYLEGSPFVGALIQAAGSGEALEASGFDTGREEALALGYRWVVLQRDAYFMVNEHQGEEEKKALLRAQQTRLRRVERRLEALLGPAAYADGRLRIYPLGDADPAELPCVAGTEGWTPDREPVAPRPVSATSSVRELPVRYLE